MCACVRAGVRACVRACVCMRLAIDGSKGELRFQVTRRTNKRVKPEVITDIELAMMDQSQELLTLVERCAKIDLKKVQN